MPSRMTSPQRAPQPEPQRRDDGDDGEDLAARSGRFRVRIDAFGRLVPEVHPVDGDDER
jgi:hypothetical protein